MTPSPDLLVLRHLSRCRDGATARRIGLDCGMSPGEVRARLVMLDSMRLVAGRQDLDSAKPRRVYHVTAEGRRRAEVSDARSTTLPRDNVST